MAYVPKYGGRPPKYDVLTKMPVEEIAAEYDAKTESGAVGFGFWMDELTRRSDEKLTRIVIRYTIATLVMTVIVTLATIVNVVIAYMMYQKML